MRLDWNDSRYCAARYYAETGFRPTAGLSDTDWAVGFLANVVFFKFVAMAALYHGLVGDYGEFFTRSVNVWTYLPRKFSEL